MTKRLLGGVFLAITLSACLSSASGQFNSPDEQRSDALKETSHDFCDSLMNLLMNFFPDSIEKSSIAVFPFQYKGEEKTSAWGTWVAEYFIKLFKKNNRFDVINRRPFRQELRELEISLKQTISDSMAVEAGKELGTDLVLAGSITPTDHRYEVAARIIDVKTGIIITGATIEATGEEIYSIEKDLLAKRSMGRLRPALLRSTFIPGWGQFYRNRPVPGVISLVACETSLGGTIYYGVSYFKPAKDDYEDYKNDIIEYGNQPKRNALEDSLKLANPQITLAEIENYIRQRGENLNDEYEEKRNIYLSLWGLTGALWAANILDVIIAGRHMHRKYRLYFTGNFYDEAGMMLAIYF
ncbi:MAG: hypothetical protein GF401_19450 [Chitinivibrionales bacterium]|nr:hypothetical protein [Chitinivibrionales bacterium]